VTEDGKVHKAWLHEILVEEITKRDLDQIEIYADRIFAKVGIDVTFPRHFLDRVNDARNKKDITTSELTRLFKQSFKKYGKKIAQLGPDAEAVINDMKTDVNMPFVLNLKGQELELVAKTIMRKKDFKTSGPKLSFEDLDERNYALEYQNYGGKPEQIARRSSRNKARRAMGDKAVKGMDVGHKDNDPLNNSPENLRNEDPSKNRREPRLREKPELDEKWYNDVMAKMSQISHPKDYEKMAKSYAAGMKDPEHRKHPTAWAQDVAQQYRGVTGRDLIKYINKLVDDGKLPKELKAELQTEEETMQTFSDLVKHINEVKQDKDVDDKKGTQPAKYYAGDMAKSTKDKRDAHFKAKKSGPAPGDDDAKTKPSTHTKKFKQMYGEVLPDDADQSDYINDFEKSDAPQFKGKTKEKRKDMAIAAYLSKNEEVELDEKIDGLVKKAEKSGMSYSILKKVYDRGMAAWKTGHRPGTTPQQWAFARVNSFTTKSSGTWGKADKDLAKQVEQIEEACWDGYKQVGMKKKGNKEVPNCVPEETDLNEWGEIEEESEYQGRKVTLNKPTSGDVKKSKVYVKNEKGNVVKVNFGDPNMTIKKSNPARRKSFRARHNCENPGPKWKARYWSCKAW
jgi:antitoxin component of RelBE/YafQ-DinJ toxin-antitoxin module